MALMMQERSAFDGLIEEIKVSEIDGAILMSLLDESHCEEYFIDDEQLNSLMRSLEEEISVNTIANHDHAIEPEIIFEVNRDCGDFDCNFDYFEWTEVEMVPSSPSDDMTWYVEEMDQMMKFVDESSSLQNCYAYNFPSEEHRYSSLWYETSDTAL
ncbi:hypothetical protein DITRI_Ditri02bG0165000 [Diplodiscus trichospermus]